MSVRLEPNLNRIFIDTSAFFALTDSRDTNHKQALTLRNRLIVAHSRLFTTNFILAETHALILARLGYKIALKVINNIDDSNTTVIRVSSSDEDRAREIVRKYQDKNFSLTDGTSFNIMEKFEIPTAFTFDRNFTQYGLQVLTG